MCACVCVCVFVFSLLQAEVVLGVSADDLAAKKNENNDLYVAACHRAQWGDWSMTVSTKSREYQGQLRMRHTVMNVKPVNYAQEGHRLLSLIGAY